MNQDLPAAAARVAAKRTELELRLEQMHKAPTFQKLAHATIIVATFLELLDHQAAVNDALIAALDARDERIDQVIRALRDDAPYKLKTSDELALERQGANA